MSYRSSARRRAQRRRRDREPGWGLRVFLIFIVCASVLFFCAVLLGKYLGRIAAPPDDTYIPVTVGDDTAPSRFDTSGVPVRIAALYVPEAPADVTSAPADSAAAEDSLPAAPGQPSVSYDAVSVMLRCRLPAAEDTAGTDSAPAEEDTSAAPAVRTGTGMLLYYTSALSASRSFDACLGGPAEALLADARSRAGYVSGIFGVMFHTEPAATRNLIREYELSLLAELSEYGLDDVVLTGFEEKDMSTALQFVREMKARTGGRMKVGIALPFAYFTGTDVMEKIARLGYDCDFLAMDLRNAEIPALMSPADVIFDRVGRVASAVSLFSVRVLVGCGPQDSLINETAGALRAGARNIQEAPRTP